MILRIAATSSQARSITVGIFRDVGSPRFRKSSGLTGSFVSSSLTQNRKSDCSENRNRRFHVCVLPSCLEGRIAMNRPAKAQPGTTGLAHPHPPLDIAPGEPVRN
jgi:hypothetical protein